MGKEELNTVSNDEQRVRQALRNESSYEARRALREARQVESVQNRPYNPGALLSLSLSLHKGPRDYTNAKTRLSDSIIYKPLRHSALPTLKPARRHSTASIGSRRDIEVLPSSDSGADDGARGASKSGCDW